MTEDGLTWKEQAEGTQVDAVSGATVSSTAAVTAINDAYAFLQTVK
nr:FMN-binding protein [uncultured Blautia sp.]